jgi:hypothetical protein
LVASSVHSRKCATHPFRYRLSSFMQALSDWGAGAEITDHRQRRLLRARRYRPRRRAPEPRDELPPSH